MRYRAHPITILANLWRVLYLIIIPVLRGFFYALQGNLADWVQSAWIDILVFLLMIGIAVWRWWMVTYTWDEEGVTLDKGWLFWLRVQIPWEKVLTVSMVEPYYLRPLRAVRLRADTLGGKGAQADFALIAWREQAEQILAQSRSRGGRRQPWEYAPRTRSVLALSLLTSNSLGGIIFIATFISQTGRLLGNEFSDMIIGTFEEVARVLAFGLPPAAAAIAYALLAGWLIGFLRSFLRYKNFAVFRSERSLQVRSGVFSTREYCIYHNDVNFIDMRQSIMTKALRLYSLYISAVGYGKYRDDINCIIPTENQETFTRNRKRLFPAYYPSPRQIAPELRGIMRFIGLALGICAAILLGTFLLIWKIPRWRSFILFVGLMSLIPAVLFLTIRIVDFSTCGVSKSGKFYTMRYSKGFYLHTVIIPKDKIVSVQVQQSPIQRFSPYCDLIVGTRAETHFHHRCRNLTKTEVEAMFKL